MSTPEETSGQPTMAQDAREDEKNAQQLEKMEEDKLKTKYPRGPGGHTAFLQKRLKKGQKYFDSGDYQMAKQAGDSVKQVFPNKNATGEAIPTPDSVPARKIQFIHPCNKFPAKK